MDLINKQVIHDSFGKGSIVECTDSFLVVNFKDGNKEFLYPDAFVNYLTLVDKKTAGSMDKILQKEKIERKLEEQRVKEEKILRFEKRKHLMEMEKLRKSHRIHKSSQVVFNCEKEELHEVFNEWKIFTGAIKSGANKGNPNKLVRTHQNTACVITSKFPNMSEKDRNILGVFMVEESFVGRLSKDGIISAHSDYRIKLTDDESKKMPFWKYYINERYPNNITWNSGRTRYFDNIWMAQILRDIISLRKDKEEVEMVQKFYEYFCFKNKLEESDIPKPNGALIQV